MAKPKIAVVFGGVSSEHDISLRSAAFIINNIPRNKYEVIPIGITKNGRWLYFPGDTSLIASGKWKEHADCANAIISPDRTHRGLIKVLEDGNTALLPVDCIFPVLHGKNGEDGTIQGLLMLSGIPYVGCDQLSSAMCMDKAITHTILDYNGIQTAKWRSISRIDIAHLEDELLSISTEIGFPCFVKPANAGSSIGVSKATSLEELKEAVKFAYTHDKKAVIEEAIEGIEVECAVKGNQMNIQASDIGSIRPSNEFYDFEAKYVSEDSALNIPAPLPKELREEIRSIASKAYRVMGCSGLSRIDFFVTEKHSIILNEINTLPGFTSISMFPKLWDAQEVSAQELIEDLIDYAIEKADYYNG